MLNRAIALVSFLLWYFLPGFYVSASPVINYLGIEKGLSNNSVRCIYQDHFGFMWFGTFDGLNRYDGYDFKIFRKQLNDSNSLFHNYINTIAEDRHNNIWVGTGQGVSFYNQVSAKFKDGQYIPLWGKEKLRIPFNVNIIKSDSSGNLFFATNAGGLLILKEGSDAAIPSVCPQDDKGNCQNDIQGLVIDKKQRVWLFVRELGLCLYNRESNRIQLVYGGLKDANCMEAGDQDNIWIGNANGLFEYHINSSLFQQVSIDLSSHVVNSLLFDRQQNLWIGTGGGGINILNPALKTVTYIQSGENKNALSGEDVSVIFEDTELRKWIGTQKGGLNIIGQQENGFQTIAHDPLNPNSPGNNYVSSFHEDENRKLWIGTDNGGISVWDRRENTYTHYKYQQGNDHSLSNNAVPCFLEDSFGNFWIATFGGGINRFDRRTNSFEHYTCGNQQTGEQHNNIWLIFEDHESNVWVATYGYGLMYRLNRAANRFEPFSKDHGDIYALAEDRSGNLWAGGSFGLARVDKEKATYQYFETFKPVRAILEDRKGRLWVGTEGLGIIQFDKEKWKMGRGFTDADGLCNNSVLNILEDDKGMLWLSTFHGLSMFDPETYTCKNYYQEDGLQSNQFSYNAALKLKSGELAFGGIKGFNIFYPGKLQTRNYNPPLLITELRINNLPVPGNSKYVSSFKDDKIESLRIPFSEAILSLDFAALEYAAPGKISYAYYLEGWDKGWNYIGNLRTANYTRLGEGNFILHIKATNAEGTWNPQEVRLKVVVLPPWYRSWWAYAFYILMVAGAIIAYQRYRASQAKLAFEIKLAKLNAQKERAERETEKVINEKEKEINEKRLTFFTNISHEFRTPLTLIINPLKDILRKPTRENHAETTELNIVYRNARRLLNLVDQLLIFRKSDTGGDRLKVTLLNFYSLCQEVYLAFAQQAKSLKMDYLLKCDNEGLQIYADREKMEIILYNLISNALKYTPPGGKVSIALTETDDRVDLEVADNGYGIPPEIGDKIFERFYQVQEKGIPSKPGFGIGLYLSRHFVESHKGKISYQSQPAKGTIFSLQFLKGREHFDPGTVFEETPAETIFSKELVDVEPVTYKEFSGGKGEPGALITENQSILLVDDDLQMLEYLDEIFSEKYTVYQAQYGEEGVKLASQYLPDIIISDVKMPGMSGIDFCKTVKKDPALSHIPVILLTGESSLEKKLEGVEGGADDYITKPFETDLLVAKVVNLLKSRSNLQNYFYNVITLRENPLKISEEYKEFLDKCIAVVEDHIGDEDFNVKKLASELNISHSNLYKKVKSISGQSVNAFIRFIRLRKAAGILINTNSNVNEAAFEVGFTSPKHFREQFAKLFGVNPSEYIRKYRKAFGKSYNLRQGGNNSEP